MYKALNLTLLATAALLAACGGKPAQDITSIDYSASCPVKSVRAAAQNEDAISRIQVGVTSWKDIKQLKRPVRRVPLVHPGAENLIVAFYQTGVPGCALLQPAPAMVTPVVIDSRGIILGYGQRTMDELNAQGWLLGTPWQWQAYNYSYLPLK